MQPKVSIIVPVYKVPEKFLRKCIESCLEQTEKDIEIMIIHDVADDDCGCICDEYARSDARVKVIHKDGKINSGLSAARNKGVIEATGKWIMFVDGDDWIEPDMCKAMLETAEIDRDTQLVMCGVSKTYGEKDEPYRYDRFDELQRFDEQGCRYLQKEILNFNSWIACAYAKLINKKYLIENNIFHDPELKLGVEGLEFNLRLFEHLEHVVFVKRWLYHYMYNDMSLSARVTEEASRYIVNGFKKMYDLILEKDDHAELEKALYDRIHYAVITIAVSGYFHPEGSGSYREKVTRYRDLLNDRLIRVALDHRHTDGMDAIRKIALISVKIGAYQVLNVMAYVRYVQKKWKVIKRKR